MEIQQEMAALPVTYTGYLHGEALAMAYASADVFAFPSRTETFGQAVLEAMEPQASHGSDGTPSKPRKRWNPKQATRKGMALLYT